MRRVVVLRAVGFYVREDVFRRRGFVVMLAVLGGEAGDLAVEQAGEGVCVCAVALSGGAGRWCGSGVVQQGFSSGEVVGLCVLGFGCRWREWFAALTPTLSRTLRERFLSGRERGLFFCGR